MNPRSVPSEVEVAVAVVGAGVVGLAVAALLSAGRSVAVIERHEGYGRENSSHNSGVLHAGIYYGAGWLKTELCIEGNRLLYAWAQEHGVRARSIGKLIVAWEEGDLPALHGLAAAAATNGVRDLRVLDRRETRSLEPELEVAGALFSGSSGIIDQMGLMRSLVQSAVANGAHIAFKHEVTGLRRHGGGFLLDMIGPEGVRSSLVAGAVVNAGGLGADRIGTMLGYEPGGGPANPPFRQSVNKGRYYDIVNRVKAARFSHLVYPLPHSDRSGLGVHVTLDIDGGVHLGPDSEWLEEGAPLDFRAADDRREQFLEAARLYLPDVTPDDLAPGQVGYRPKLYGQGEPARDFLIWHDRGYVHLGGIESPGLTASLAIARRVGAILGVDPAPASG